MWGGSSLLCAYFESSACAIVLRRGGRAPFSAPLLFCSGTMFGEACPLRRAQRRIRCAAAAPRPFGGPCLVRAFCFRIFSHRGFNDAGSCAWYISTKRRTRCASVAFSSLRLFKAIGYSKLEIGGGCPLLCANCVSSFFPSYGSAMLARLVRRLCCVAKQRSTRSADVSDS